MDNSQFEQLISRAENALASGWLDECKDLLETVRIEHGESSRWANNCGVLAVQQARPDEALGFFERAFQLDTSNLSAAMNLSRILVMLNRHDEASRLLNRLLPVVQTEYPDAVDAVRAELDAVSSCGTIGDPLSNERTAEPDRTSAQSRYRRGGESLHRWTLAALGASRWIGLSQPCN